MKNKKLYNISCWCATILFIFNIAACWIFSNWQDVFVPIANVITFMALSILFLSQVDVVSFLRKKDRELFILIGGCFLAAVNMLIIKSNIGAIFTIVNLFLILYLADKIILPEKCIWLLTISFASIAFYWIFIKRASYLDCDYNTNRAALIVFSLIIFLICGLNFLIIENKWNKKWFEIFLVIILIVLFWQSINFRARCVTLGILTIIIMYYLIPKKPWTIYGILTFTFTFPLMYVLIWKMGLGNKFRFLDKNLMSGREEIWYDFFNVYIKYPITGIGSNFEQMLPDSKILDIHHALLDILFVHGLPVFLLILYFLIKRLKTLVGYSNEKSFILYISIIYGMLVVGTFENYYITGPFSVIFFLIFMLSFQHKKVEKE